MQRQGQRKRQRPWKRQRVLEEAQRWPCKGWLAGKQRHENARSKCSNKCPDQQWKKIQRSLNSKRSWQASCWTRNVDDGANPDSLALPAEPCVHAPSPREPAPLTGALCRSSTVHTLVKESPAPRRRSPVSMLPVPTLCAWWCRGRTRGKQQCKHSHPMGTLPDPISGPRDSGMAQASSSSGSAPAQVLDDAAHRGQASQRAQHEHGPHLNNTPDFLSELDPPEDFRLRLSFNDHRFKAEIMTKQYVSSEGKKSCSKSFANDRSEWKASTGSSASLGMDRVGEGQTRKGNCRLIVSLVLSLRLSWNALPRLSMQCLRLQSMPSSLFSFFGDKHITGENMSAGCRLLSMSCM